MRGGEYHIKFYLAQVFKQVEAGFPAHFHIQKNHIGFGFPDEAGGIGSVPGGAKQLDFGAVVFNLPGQEEYELKKGNFDKVLQDVVAKKDQEISKRDRIIEQYKVETPILEAASEYRDWETDRKSTRLNSSHSAKSRMPSSA